MSKRIAVIGCGAKALAVGVKVDALAHLGCPVYPTVEIFERTEAAGALWSADNSGYSDGSPHICTSFSRDLGYPYSHFFHPEAVDGTASELRGIRRNVLRDHPWRAWDSEIWPGVSNYAFARYSTTAWLRSGISNAPDDKNLHLPSKLTFKRWVDEGERQLTHQEFASYLRWVATALEKSGVVQFHYRSEVKRLNRVEQNGDFVGWEVAIAGPDTGRVFDGVIISGNGPVREPSGYVAPADEILDRCLDMRDFWKPTFQRSVERRLEDDYAQIIRKQSGKAPTDFSATSAARSEPETVRAAIAGAGGAATAVAARMLRMSVPISITILGSPAALYSRENNPFEEQYYGSNTLWEQLELEKKIEFLRRLGASASWSNQIGELAASGRVDYRSSYWLGWRAKSGLVEPLLRVNGRPRGARALFHLGVNATGYNTFAHIVGFFANPSSVRDLILATGGSLNVNSNSSPQNIEELSSRSFELRPGDPNGQVMLQGLHLPDLCSIRGPASTNLMALGWIADSILKDYIGNVN